MSVTSLIKPVFMRRVKAARYNATHTEAVQRQQLAWLLSRASRTETGRRYGFDAMSSYEDFAAKVPIIEYPDMRHSVERMIQGERDILWPGATTHFAQSSGTSDGKSKYIPITADSFKLTHYRGGFDVVAHYLSLYPDSRIFDGKSFILGGSYANELTLPRGVVVGDLSANLIDRINPLVNLVRVPSKRVALMKEWNEKLPALVEASMHENITNISGVPSWFMTVIKSIIERTGADTIHDVWPNLEVFFHGGISFEPYREQYARITDPSRMRYLETYNASEGFFALQNDIDDHAMMLLLDLATFYEFIPIDQTGIPFPEALPAWKVEPGHTYALAITSCNGLWRYAIGDTVTVKSVEPLKITIAGRVKHFINAFGEELMVHNADAAIARTCHELDCSIANYTAAPVYAGDHTRGRHEWLIEFNRRPADMNQFAALLDQNLQAENSDYQAKRTDGLFLDPLTVIEARKGLFDSWLASTGKLGGQRKVPRLSNDRRFIEPMLKFNDDNNDNK